MDAFAATRGGCAVYRRRRQERTRLYRTAKEHLETYLAHARRGAR